MRAQGLAGPASASGLAEGRRPAAVHRAAQCPRSPVRGRAPNQKWIADFTYIWTAEGWLYVAAVIDLFSRRVVGWSMKRRHDRPAGHRCAHHGDLAARQARRPAAPFRSRQPIHQRAVPAADGRSRHHLLDEPIRQCLGQCGDGELLLVAQDRAHRPARSTAPATTPGPMCSTTSSASTTRSGGTRPSAISALLSSRTQLG